jgi:hypothetical protein|tara:strand:- start:6285 stop:7217 length:933 start_codon:yes stop_codon:yes gene_type:complete
VVREYQSYYTYADVDQFKNYLAGSGYSSSWTNDKTELRRILRAVSSDMEVYCGYNTWGPILNAISFDIGSGSLTNDVRPLYPTTVNNFTPSASRIAELPFPYWLISVTTATSYEGTARTSSETWSSGLSNDYLLLPYDATPSTGLKQSTESEKSFKSGQQTFVIDGTWGWQNTSSAVITTTEEALDVGEVAIDVASSANLSEGMVIKVESEIMYIESISSNTITVNRGIHGSTDASHTTGQNITSYIYPTDVIQTCCELARVKYREKDLGLNRDLGSGEMSTTIPTREAKLIMKDLDRYSAYNKQNSVVF